MSVRMDLDERSSESGKCKTDSSTAESDEVPEWPLTVR